MSDETLIGFAIDGYYDYCRDKDIIPQEPNKSLSFVHGKGIVLHNVRGELARFQMLNDHLAMLGEHGEALWITEIPK